MIEDTHDQHRDSQPYQRLTEGARRGLRILEDVRVAQLLEELEDREAEADEGDRRADHRHERAVRAHARALKGHAGAARGKLDRRILEWVLSRRNGSR